MPVKDEAARALGTLDALRGRAAEFGARGVTVFVVDDGSSPPVDARDLPPPTRTFRIVLARHAINLGQGAALETARQLALAGHPRFDVYVTMDSDGQHDVDGALAVARAVRSGAEVAFGNRFLGDSKVPRGRLFVLACARLFDDLFTGLHLSDAHNGLRAFNRRALESICIRQNGMAHASEIKRSISCSTPPMTVVEVPVTIRYTADTLAKGQRGGAGAIAVLHDLLVHYLFGEPA
jgi:glycosyltransferase involved in cell wall biosynthesis